MGERMETGWTAEDVYRVAECGHALYREGRYREAAVIFEGLVAVDPASPYCRESLAALYLILGDPQNAIVELNQVLERDPDHAGARARRCEAWWRLGRRTQAQLDFERLAGFGAEVLAARLRVLLELPPPWTQLPPEAQR
jgi:tetratricopeptide (TPR) repeat protein